MNLLKNKLQLFVTMGFVGFLGWWLSFQRIVDGQGLSVQRFGYTYGVLALIGGIIGLVASHKWGGYHTVLGKALLFFSLGLFAQEAGQLILAYYIYVSKIQIPYPSWGDLAYFGSTLFYIAGGVFLTKAVGIKFSLKSARYKVVAYVVPIGLLLVSITVFLYHHQYDWHKPLTVFLDSGYPIGDATYISLVILAYLLSRKMLGGIMRSGIVALILALLCQYASDFSFLYQSSRGTYLAGRYVDLLYLITYFVATSAMIMFLTTFKELKTSTKTATPEVEE